MFFYNPHHINEFRKYLKPGDSFSLTEDFDATHCIQITSDGLTTFRAAFGLMDSDSPPPHFKGDSHIINLIRIALLQSDRRVALLHLRGGDAQRALDLIYKVWFTVTVNTPRKLRKI